MVLLVGQGLVIVCMIDGCVMGLDFSNGECKWIYQCFLLVLNLCSSFLMIFFGDNIIFGFVGGKFGVLLVSNGVLCWEVVVLYLCGVLEIECLNDVMGVLLVNGL